MRLGKVVPPSRHVLKDISLSFYPDAKIGVIGSNGAGKSSLLRIFAGVDHDFIGEARPADGIRIGFLEQEPKLDPAKDVRGNVEDGVAPIRALLDEFNAISAKFAEPMSDEEMNAPDGAAGRGPEPHRPRRRVGAGPPHRRRDGRAPLPARRAGRGDPLRRREAPRGAVPPAALAARPAAPRRADEPPRRRVRGVARAAPRTTSPAASSPSRTTATSSTTWRAGSSSWTAARASPGRATTRAGSSRRRSGSRWRRRRSRRGGRRWSASWSGSGWRPAPGRPRARRASPPSSSWRRRRRSAARTPPRSSSRRRPASATRSSWRRT